MPDVFDSIELPKSGGDVFDRLPASSSTGDVFDRVSEGLSRAAKLGEQRQARTQFRVQKTLDDEQRAKDESNPDNFGVDDSGKVVRLTDDQKRIRDAASVVDRNPLMGLIHGATFAGKLLWGALADATAKKESDKGENTLAAINQPNNEPLPVDKGLSELKTVGGAVTKGIGGVVKSLPVMAAGGPAGMTVGVPLAFGAEKYNETGDLPQSAQAALTAELFPAVGKVLQPVGVAANQSLIKNGIIDANNATAQKAVETTIHQAGFNAAAHLVSLPEYAQMSPEDRKLAIIEGTVANTVFSLPEVLKLSNKSIPSSTQEAIRQSATEQFKQFNSKQYADVIRSVADGEQPDTRLQQITGTQPFRMNGLSRSTKLGGNNAVQEPSATTIPVRPGTETSPQVAEEVRPAEEPTGAKVTPPATVAESSQPNVVAATEKPVEANPPASTSGTASTGKTTYHPYEIARDAETPPVEEKVESMVDTTKYPVKRVDPRTLKLSAEVPNFKGNADLSTGEVTPIEGEKYDYRDTGAVQVWVRLNGDKEIISGRHRWNQALRTGSEIPVQEHLESEGFTANHARILDAELNIRDGQGEVSDYANYFRNTKQLYDEAKARERGLLRGAKSRTGWNIGHNAADDLYALWSAGRINEVKASAIASAAPGDANLQRFGLKSAENGASAGQIVSRIESAKAYLQSPVAKATQGRLFDDQPEWKALEDKFDREGDYVAAKRQAIQDIITTRSAILRRFDVATSSGSIKADAKKAQRELDVAQTDMERWKNWALSPELKAEVEAATGGNNAPTENRQNENEQRDRFLGIVKLAADSPTKLRASDVDRVMSEANKIPSELETFRTWLLSKALSEDTMREVVDWKPEPLDTGTGDMFGDSVPTKPAEQLSAEKAAQAQRDAIAEGQGKKLTGAVDTTMDMLENNTGDVPLLNQNPNLKQGKLGDGSVAEGEIKVGNATITPPRIDRQGALTAHHGTPHKVDRFSTEKIGTGEGAQVYGWGLYFAENPAVSKRYAAELGKTPIHLKEVTGKKIEPSGWWENEALRALTKAHGDFDAALAAFAGREDYDQYRKILNQWRERGASVEGGGKEYTVSINAEPDELLQWDKPLSQQSKKVQEGFYKVLGRRPTFTHDITGAEMYRMMMGGMNDADMGYLRGEVKKRTDEIYTAGIKGIQYLDQFSRAPKLLDSEALRNELRDALADVDYLGFDTAAQAMNAIRSHPDWETRWDVKGTRLADIVRQHQENGTSNYVIFKDTDIQITHENGKSVTLPEAMRQGMLAKSDATTSVGTETKVVGTEAIRELIRRPEANLPVFARRVIEAMLNTPVMRDMDWSRLELVIRDRIDGGFSGAAGVLDNLVELSRTADATTFPHELFHFLFEMLPTDDRLTVDALRREAIKNFDRTGLSPDAVALLDKLDRGETLASDDFQKDLPRELYKLINPSEFLAEMAGEKFASGVFSARTQGVIGQLIDHVKGWVQGVIDSLKRVFGVRPSLEQIYRELLAGKHSKAMLDTVVEYARGRQGAFAKDAEEARNAETLAQTHEQQEVEATHLLAQSHDTVDVLGKHGTGTIGDASKTLLGWFDYLGIDAAGRRLNGGIGEGYRQLKARVTDAYRRNWLARMAHQQFSVLDQRLRNVITERDEEQKKLMRPGFLRTLAREASAKMKMDHADVVLRVTQSIFHSAITLAKKALRDESKSDLEIAHIEGELAALDDAEKSSSAMQQLLNDMVAVVSSTPDGMRALTDTTYGTRKEIIRIYADIKRSTDPEGQLHKSSLLNWAAYILHKSKELRETLLAAEWARNSTIRAGMGPYEAKFLADFESDPIKTIKREIRTQSKLATDAQKAAFAWRTLHREVTARLDHFAVLDDAATVAENVMADPDLKGLRSEVKDDAQVIGSLDPAKPFTKNTVLLPDGTVCEIDPDKIVGSRTEFAGVRAGFEAAISQLDTWLNNPANAGDINYRMHERNRGTLQDYFSGLSMLQPNDPLRLFKRSFEIVRNAVGIAGGRVAAQVRVALSSLDHDSRQASWWTQRYTNSLAESAQRAIRSHGIKYSTFGDMSVHDANRLWYDRVGNQLFYSFNRSAGALKVGDVLASGEKVTQADIDHVRLTAESVSKGFDILGNRQMTQDTLGGFTTFRRALKGNALMTTRVFNDDLANFAKDFMEHRAAHLEATSAGNAAAASAAEAKMLGVLDTYFSRIGTALTWDRNPEFAKTTPFDGPGGAFEYLGKWMSNDPTRITNTSQYFNELAALSTLSVDEAKRVILQEWGRIIEGWHREAVNTESTEVPRAEETKNSFTRSRNDAIAPYVFYENGFRNSHSVQKFGSGIQSRAMDDVISGLDSLVADIERQQKEFADQVARTAGAPKEAEKQVRTKRAIERANGDNYDSYDDLERRKKLVKDARDLMADKANDTDVDVTFGRYVGALTGILIGTAATARNVTSGPRYLGQLARRLNASNLRSNPLSMWYGWLDMPVRLLASLAYGVPKATLFDLPVGAGKAIAGLSDPQRRNVESVIHTMFRGVIQELGENVYTRVAEVKRMIDAGVHHVPDATAEWDNKMLGTWMTHGLILERDLSTIDKVLQAPSAVVETMILTFQKTLMPLFGDTGLNMATSMLLKGKFGPFQQLEHALRRVYADYKARGYRTFDFTNPRSEANVLSHQEIFPRGVREMRVSSSERDMQNLREQFEAAGMNFDEKAAEFLTQLDHGKIDAKFLNDADRDSMTNAAIDFANRASLTNNPLNLKKKNFINNLIKPFMFWKVRTLSNFLNDLSTSARTDKRVTDPGQLFRQRAMQVAVASTMILLPLMFWGAMTNAGDEEANRKLKLALFNQITGFRQPWERDGAGSQGRGWLVHAFNGIPFLDMAMNTMFNDMPNRASFDPSLAAVEKANDVARYIGGVAQTGDITYKLPQLISGLFPDVKAVTSRMESQAGMREVNNVAALATRHGPTELLRQSSGGNAGGVMANELTPYADKMVNAAAGGNMTEFQKVYEEAVQVARNLGRPDPEKVVAQMFKSRNPYSRALKSEMTPEQREAFLARLTPEQREKVDTVEANLQQAAQTVGTKMSFVSGDERSQRVSRGSGTLAAGTASASTSGASGSSGASASSVGGGRGSLSRAGRVTGRARVTSRGGRLARGSRAGSRRKGFARLSRAPRLA